MSELEEIKLLLRQQLDAFQEQMAALQADLQATKGLIQVRRYGGVGETASPIPRSMRLDVPKFSGIDPDQWFRWMTRNNLITTWDGFLESVQNRFGPCEYENPQGALSKLLQKGAVAQYQGEFEKLMYRVTDESDGLLISFYIFGLKPAIQLELLVSKPTSLGDVFAPARVTEARLDDQRVSIVSQATTVASRGGSQRTQSSRISAAEDALEGGDVSILNSLVGYGSPRSLQLWGVLGAKKVHILIGRSETLLCEILCSRVTLDIQGLPMDVDLYVLPRKGPDIVLGFQWLQNLGKVTHDYLNQAMKFSWSGRDYALKGEEQVVNLSEDEHEGQPMEQPLPICDTRIVLQKGVPVRQVLVQWSGRPPEEATCEWLSEFQEAYPSYHLKDKVISEGEKNVTPGLPRDGRTKRTKSKPAWHKDYVMQIYP
ncbi:ty3-gypsy retrotransposon protein [Tanacetum coccineum]